MIWRLCDCGTPVRRDSWCRLCARKADRDIERELAHWPEYNHAEQLSRAVMAQDPYDVQDELTRQMEAVIADSIFTPTPRLAAITDTSDTTWLESSPTRRLENYTYRRAFQTPRVDNEQGRAESTSAYRQWLETIGDLERLARLDAAAERNRMLGLLGFAATYPTNLAEGTHQIQLYGGPAGGNIYIGLGLPGGELVLPSPPNLSIDDAGSRAIPTTFGCRYVIRRGLLKGIYFGLSDADSRYRDDNVSLIASSALLDETHLLHTRNDMADQMRIQLTYALAAQLQESQLEPIPGTVQLTHELAGIESRMGMRRFTLAALTYRP